MKNNSSALLLSTALLLGTAANAQHWTDNISTTRPDFHEVKQAFNTFWEPYHVNNGWYTDADGRRHKAAGWKQYKRWENYWEQRTGPTGEFPSNLVECDEWEKYVKSAGKGSAGSAKSASNWTSMGPNTSGNIAGTGRINCIAFHPTNANTYWVGTPAGGMWKTTDAGASWTTNTDELPVLGVSWIAIHPTDPDVMYIATGDGDAALSLSAFGHPFAGDTKSIGILKSTDGGSTWTQVLGADQEDGVLIRKVLIDPAFPQFVYAATSLGIYQSQDGGATWNNILGGYFMDLEFNPGNSDVVYAASYDPTGGAQVYVTEDYGQNWLQGTSLFGVNRIDIAVTPASPNSVDILCSDAATHGLHSLYYSTDAGGSWAPYWTGGAGSNLLGWYGDASDADGQGGYDLTLAIDPANYNNILVGDVNAWKTTNGGASWATSSMWSNDPYWNAPPNVPVVHADKHHITYHPTQANTIFDCNDGGVYRSTDGGSSWTNLTNGIVNSQMYGISCSQTDPELVLAGLQDNGTIGYEQGAWTQVTGGDGMLCHIDPVNANYLYASYASGVLYRIDVGANSITTISENLPGGQQPGEWVTPYQLDPNNPAVLFAGYESFYRTSDRGDSWTLLSTPVPGAKMNYLAVAPTNSNTIYVGYLDRILRSTNGGTDWTDVTDGLPTWLIYLSSILVDPTDADNVIVTLSGYSETNKVFSSDNGGETWTNITATGLPNLPVNCAETDPATGDLYLGTDAGVYVWDGSAWAEDNQGLPNVVVTDLDMQHSAGRLRAGTFGRGMWETSLFSVGQAEEPHTNDLTVLPNPTDGQFAVVLNDLRAHVQRVELLNSTGQLAWQSSGTGAQLGRLEVDASHLATGIYLLNVHTTRGLHTQRLVVE